MHSSRDCQKRASYSRPIPYKMFVCCVSQSARKKNISAVRTRRAGKIAAVLLFSNSHLFLLVPTRTLYPWHMANDPVRPHMTQSMDTYSMLLGLVAFHCVHLYVGMIAPALYRRAEAAFQQSLAASKATAPISKTLTAARKRAINF